MRITINHDLEKKIVAFCDDELNYHINECGCAEEYKDEIEAQIELLRLMGYDEMADRYDDDFIAYMDDYEYRRSKEPIPWDEADFGDEEFPEPDNGRYGLWEE